MTTVTWKNKVRKTSPTKTFDNYSEASKFFFWLTTQPFCSAAEIKKCN